MSTARAASWVSRAASDIGGSSRSARTAWARASRSPRAAAARGRLVVVGEEGREAARAVRSRPWGGRAPRGQAAAREAARTAPPLPQLRAAAAGQRVKGLSTRGRSPATATSGLHRGRRGQREDGGEELGDVRRDGGGGGGAGGREQPGEPVEG